MLNLGRRYRPPALLLMVMGLFALLPSFIEELQNDAIEPESLALVGLVVILVGAGLWLFSVLASVRSYVEVRPDVLLVREPFRRTMISYHRIKLVQPVQVSQLYPKKSLKGMGRAGPPVAGDDSGQYRCARGRAKDRLVRRYGRYLFLPAYRGLAVHCPLVRHADPPDRRGGAAQAARARRGTTRTRSSGSNTTKPGASTCPAVE